MGEIGIITEQGDLGLGFEELNESDKAKLENQDKKENKGNKDGAK